MSIEIKNRWTGEPIRTVEGDRQEQSPDMTQLTPTQAGRLGGQATPDKHDHGSHKFGWATVRGGKQGFYDVQVWQANRDLACGECGETIPEDTLHTKRRPGMTGPRVYPVCFKCRPFREFER